jgi:hypothetical protein
MEADYEVELGAGAPALELPWEDPEGRWNYVDLRGEAGAAGPDWERNLKRCIDRIPETRQFPPLRRFLLDVNSLQSAWQTAKCSVWPETAKAEDNLYNAAFTHSCYVDLVLAEPFAPQRTELELHERLAKQLAAALVADARLEAQAEIVVRRCYFHRGAITADSDAGYCLTLFLIGYGAAAAKASESLRSALALAGESLLKLQPA